MSISKQYLKTKPACKVTFKLTADRLPAATQVALLGYSSVFERKTPLAQYIV